MADYIINLWNLYQMFWISKAIPYYSFSWMLRSRKVLWSSGISWMRPYQQFQNQFVNAVFAKTAGLSDKTSKFSFCPAAKFSLSDKCLWFLAKRDSNLITDKPPVLQNFIFGQVYRNGTGVIQELSKKEKFWGNFRISERSFGPNFGFPYMFYIFLLLPQL